jgi:cytochrome c553
MRQSAKILLLLVGVIVGVFRRVMSDSPPAEPKDEQQQHSLPTFWQAAKVLGIAAVVAGFIGLVVLISGVMPIKASSGHWQVTRWFLEFAKQRSVATHSVTIEAPPLSDPVLVQKGAGAYENNCRVCHGSPKLPQPPVAQHMLPRPPYLPSVVSEWEPEELFHIVKHGLKFTGMPAWPSQQRDDEVWAVVAFLQAFPGLDQNGYRELVGPDASPYVSEEFNEVLRHCESCHGPQGLGRGLGAAPRLAGQKVDYLYASLSAYARQQRFSGIMQPVAARLNDGEMLRLAQHYANLPRIAPTPTSNAPADVQRGEKIANDGIREQRVPACNSCHGPGGPRNPVYPELSGQYANYIVLQLKLFQREQRGGTSYAHLMRHVAPQLDDEQMRDVAVYYESLSPQALLPVETVSGERRQDRYE